MRTLIFVLIMVAETSIASGQVLISLLLGDKLNNGKMEFGLDGGINYPDLRGLSNSSLNGNFNIGFYFDIKLKNPQWMIHTGVLVKSSMGADELPVYALGDPDLDNAFAGGDVRRKINYFNVPICMKHIFANHFYLEGGLMPSLRNKAYDIFTASVQGSDLAYKKDIRDQVHPLDFGLIGGVGYRLMGGNGMNLTLRYYYGLVDVIIDDSNADQFNTSLFISVGIPIGAGKTKEEKNN